MTYWSSGEWIFFLGIILIILIIIRIVLSKNMNREYIQYANSTITGKEEVQEDFNSVISKEYGTLAVLADGFGKNKCGRIASIIAVKTIRDLFEKEFTPEKIFYFLKKAFIEANKEVLIRLEGETGGASVLAVIIKNDLLYYALVGEVMLCIFRNKELVKISEGHTMGEVAKKQYGEGKIERHKALYALKENKLLHYMGEEIFEDMEVSDPPIKLKKNDIIVLMSKGIFESAKWVDIERILCKRNRKVDELCDEVIESLKLSKVNSNGSIVLIKN